MGYLTTNSIADDPYMQQRVAACAAQQGIADVGIDPTTWTKEWRLVWAASPGWDATWEAAVANPENPPGYHPGMDEAVILDANIMAQVQSMMPFHRIGEVAT